MRTFRLILYHWSYARTQGLHISFQVVVSSISFIASPPDVRMRMPVVTQKFTELYCDLRLEGLLPPLAYNLSLVLVTAILGYLTRKLPENYNESWYIFVSVATTMFLWVVFVPTYLTTFFVVHQVVLLTCCVMINATVTLFCLFLPKIYAVYFVDEQHLKLFTRTTRVSQASTSPEQRHNDSTCWAFQEYTILCEKGTFTNYSSVAYILWSTNLKCLGCKGICTGPNGITWVMPMNLLLLLLIRVKITLYYYYFFYINFIVHYYITIVICSSDDNMWWHITCEEYSDFCFYHFII